MLIEKHAAHPGMACHVLGLPRSTYYYHAQAKRENGLKEAVQSVAGQFPTYGTRRIIQRLRRAPYHYAHNRKRIQCLMRSMHLLRPVKRVKIRTTASEHGFPRSGLADRLGVCASLAG